MLSDRDITEGLAAAFHDRADPTSGTTVDPAGIFPRGVRARRRRAAVRAAAASLGAALVAVVLAVNLSAGPAPVVAEPPPGMLLTAAVISPPPAGTAVAGMPRYYVTLDHSRPVAEVRASTTGKVLTTVALPRLIDPKMSQIAAVGDGRGFALALFSFPQTRFYWLRVSADGRSARLTALNAAPLPAGEYADGLAVSPGGSRLAVAIQRSGGSHGAVEVVSLATGAARTWTTGRSGIPAGLSWADGHRLGFFWTAGGAQPQRGVRQVRPVRGIDVGLWELDTAAPGHELFSGRRILPLVTGGDTVQYAQLTTAGTVIAAVTYTGTGHVHRGTVVGGIVELSAQTGHPLRTLLAEHAAHSLDPELQPGGWYITPCELAAADRTGSHLLVSCDRFGRLDRGRFTPLPGAVPQSAVAAAW
jgi:hypothetical protein